MLGSAKHQLWCAKPAWFILPVNGRAASKRQLNDIEQVDAPAGNMLDRQKPFQNWRER